MLKKDADYDMGDPPRRIARQASWIEQLKSCGQTTSFAKQELAELKATLDHIEHTARIGVDYAEAVWSVKKLRFFTVLRADELAGRRFE